MQKITINELRNVIEIYNEELADNGITNFYWRLAGAYGSQNVNLVHKQGGWVKLSTGYGTRKEVWYYLKNAQLDVLYNANKYM